jgi:hypothetical protein
VIEYSDEASRRRQAAEQAKTEIQKSPTAAKRIVADYQQQFGGEAFETRDYVLEVLDMGRHSRGQGAGHAGQERDTAEGVMVFDDRLSEVWPVLVEVQEECGVRARRRRRSVGVRAVFDDENLRHAPTESQFPRASASRQFWMKVKVACEWRSDSIPSEMKWITREKVKVDRVACPWLITKFVDPQADFIFVPANKVEAKACELGGTPFDIEGCEHGHHGEDVSFDCTLKKYNLTDAALVLLGEIVRAADSYPSNPHPAGEGLRWIAFGFSALRLSDHEILERELIVYVALYAECQRRAASPGKA